VIKASKLRPVSIQNKVKVRIKNRKWLFYL